MPTAFFCDTCHVVLEARGTTACGHCGGMLSPLSGDMPADFGICEALDAISEWPRAYPPVDQLGNPKADAVLASVFTKLLRQPRAYRGPVLADLIMQWGSMRADADIAGACDVMAAWWRRLDERKAA